MRFTDGVCQNATKACRVVAKQHIAYEETEAGVYQQGVDYVPGGALASVRHCMQLESIDLERGCLGKLLEMHGRARRQREQQTAATEKWHDFMTFIITSSMWGMRSIYAGGMAKAEASLARNALEWRHGGSLTKQNNKTAILRAKPNPGLALHHHICRRSSIPSETRSVLC